MKCDQGVDPKSFKKNQKVNQLMLIIKPKRSLFEIDFKAIWRYRDLLRMFVYRDFSLFDYIIKPLYWLGMFGFIPAFIVGVVGSFIARRLLRIHENA